MSAWLKDFEYWNGDTNDVAVVAFREMGTNAIPGLLRILQSGGPRWQRRIMDLNRKQSVVELPFGTPWLQTMAAAWALYYMGADARPALPALTNLLFHSNALITSSIALAGIGPDALPSLLVALTNQNYRIRLSAANGLGWEKSDTSIVVPALIEALEDVNIIVRHAAAGSLGSLHAEPHLSVPALTNAFSSNDALLRATVLISLGQFGSSARESVPVILTAVKDADPLVRANAAEALKQIDPDAAARAGVK